MRRVVVTGLGMVTPLANGVEPTWSKLLAGESGIRTIEAFDVSDLPAKSFDQVGSTPFASGVTMPSPVTTTRLIPMAYP